MENVITLSEVNKKFKKTKAINNISLEIRENRIYGLIGKNGAGKTTLLNLIARHYLPTSGTIQVMGKVFKDNRDLLKTICCVSQANIMRIKDFFSIETVIKQTKLFYPNFDKEFAYQLIDKFDIPRDKKIKHLSQGNVTLVADILGLATRCPVTMFDEPYQGLDAINRDMFYQVLNEDFIKHPRTIIISTHLIDEASHLFEEVIMIDKGQIVIRQTKDELEEKAFIISGDLNKLYEVTKNKKVIYREDFGKFSTVALFERLTDEDKKMIHEYELSIQKLGLQKLFVYLGKESNEGGFYEN